MNSGSNGSTSTSYAYPNMSNAPSSYNMSTTVQSQDILQPFVGNIELHSSLQANYGNGQFQGAPAVPFPPPQLPTMFNVPPPNFISPAAVPPLGVLPPMLPPPNFPHQNMPVHVAMGWPPQNVIEVSNKDKTSEDQKWVIRWSEGIEKSTMKSKPSGTSIKVCKLRLLQFSCSNFSVSCASIEY